MNKLTQLILSVVTGVMLLGMTAFASEYSVTPANAIFYTNGETVVLADASVDAQVILPECEAGLPIQVTGVTSNGYWQIVLGDATYYVLGAGLSQTAEMAISTPKASVQAKAPKPAQSASTSEAFPYELNTVYDNGTVAWVFWCDAVEHDNWSDAYNAASKFNRLHHDIFNNRAAFEEVCEAVGLALPGSNFPGVRQNTKWYINGVVVDVSFCL